MMGVSHLFSSCKMLKRYWIACLKCKHSKMNGSQMTLRYYCMYRHCMCVCGCVGVFFMFFCAIFSTNPDQGLVPLPYYI